MSSARRVTKKSLADIPAMPPEPKRGVVSSYREDGFAVTGDRRDVRVVCLVCDRKEIFAKKDRDGVQTFQQNHRVVCKAGPT